MEDMFKFLQKEIDWLIESDKKGLSLIGKLIRIVKEQDEEIELLCEKVKKLEERK